MEKPKMSFSIIDVAFAAAMIVCGFLYWNLVLDVNIWGAGVTIFSVIIFAVTFIYVTKSGFKQNPQSIVCLILAALAAAQFSLFDGLFVSILNFLFLSAIFVYWVCLVTGRRIDTKLSIYALGDVIQQGVIVPLANFICCLSAIANFPKKKSMTKILLAIGGIVIFLPFLIAVVLLLISADLAFENFVREVFGAIHIEAIIRYIWHFVFGIPIASYLFGLIYGDVKGRYVDQITVESMDDTARIIRIAPEVTIYSALTAFNIIYLVFFLVQAAYLFSAFSGNLPEMFTYAEYARRGFFELCAVAGINLGVLAIAHLTMKRDLGEERKMLRIQAAAISLSTLLLIVTALSKMILYIDAYGLTQLRVFTSWFMILLLFIFVIVGVRQFKKFNATRFAVGGFIVLFLLLSYGNVDGIIAQYNINRYEAGTLETLDFTTLARLSDAAVPHLDGMYQRADGNDELRQQLALTIRGSGTRETHGFREFNYQRHQAYEIRNGIKVE